MKIHHNIAKMFGYELLRKSKSHERLDHHLPKILEKLGIDLVLDVGGNIGQFAMSLRENGFKGDIISFEPVSEIFEILKHKSQNDSRWMTFNFALGDSDEEAEINVPTSTVFSSLLDAKEYTKVNFGEHYSELRKEKISIRTLDNIVNGKLVDINSKNVFLKLDTQGYDLKVLLGSTKTLPRVLGMQTELSFIPLYEKMPSHIEVLKFIDEMGFSITGLFPVSREDSTFKILEMDCIAIR